MDPQSPLNNLRPRTVLNPIAPTVKVCDAQRKGEIAYKSLLSKVDSLKSQSRILYYVAVLQIIGSFRISEVLNIKPTDIMLSGHVLVQGSKGSANQLIHSGEVSDYLVQCKSKNIYPFAALNRFFVYRQYRKVGIIYKSHYSGKLSVTHAFRQYNVELMRVNDIENEEISKHLGHKNKSNQSYYGNSKKA